MLDLLQECLAPTWLALRAERLILTREPRYHDDTCSFFLLVRLYAVGSEKGEEQLLN